MTYGSNIISKSKHGGEKEGRRLLVLEDDEKTTRNETTYLFGLISLKTTALALCGIVSVLGITSSMKGRSVSRLGAYQFNNDGSLRAIDVTQTNLVMVKTVKTAGSTLAGISRRIADRHGIWGANANDLWIQSEPGLWASHSSYQELESKIYSLKKPTFLYTAIRDPITRTVSQFQMEIMESLQTVDSHLTHQIKCFTENSACYMPQPQSTSEIEDRLVQYAQDSNTEWFMDYLSEVNNAAPGNDAWSPNQIVDHYDFVVISERFDESIVAMMHFFPLLTLQDIVYYYSKDSKYRWGGPSDMSQTTKNKLTSIFAGSRDYILYDYASKKLDEVISKIPNFALELAVYQKFREYSQEKCQEYGPSSGQCLWQDQGCAQECFNKIDYHSFTALMATVLPKTSELAAYLKIRSV
jgi:hypothetical protein